MMENPQVSVIIVVYNAGNIIERAIASVVAQTYKNTELLVIDGGSSEETIQAIQNNRAAVSYFISEPDQGIYDAMNKGIRAAKGEWIFFLGADDVLYSNNTLSEIFNGEKELEKTDFLYGNVRFRSNNRQLGGSRDYHGLVESNIPHQAIFYRRSVFEKLGNYNKDYRILADWDMNLRIYRDPSLVKKYMDRDVSLFNDKGGASNVTIDSRFFSEQLVYFIGDKNMPAYLLQPYYFYDGIIQLFRNRKIKGLFICLKACFKGRRKIYFISLFCRFCFYFAGIGKKIRFV